MNKKILSLILLLSIASAFDPPIFPNQYEL
jgi:hypothetical protein